VNTSAKSELLGEKRTSIPSTWRKVAMSTRAVQCILRTVLPAAGLAVLLASLSAAEPAAPQKGGPSPEQWNKTVDQAIAYLRSTQAEDGSWSEKQSPGITGIILTGLLRTGKVGPKDPMVERGLKYVEGLINPKAGHIAGKDPRVQLQNYVTCVNVLALTSAGRDSYKQVVADAVKFLRTLQWDEGEGKNRDSDFYGGAGYDSKSRPDLSNTQFFLDALVAAGVPRDDPAFKKAMIFVSRCQNLESESNKQPWAGKIDDGSFIYSAAGGGATKVQDAPGADGSLPGYGSMTYAGIKSLIYCGVDRKDQRIQKALEWIKKNYTVERNPGMPPQRAHWGLYYYYHTMAKCLDVLGDDFVVDAMGRKHDWRADLADALARRQNKDGSWRNEQGHWMESNPEVVTGYALMTLSYCKPKK
jgi:squalene-hopene/tetraprenyl-beta-curcumene cyclase